MEVNKLWKNNDINKYYIITLDKETNEWKFFKEIVGHTVFWKDEPSRYGMTKSKAVEVLNIVKSLTNEDVKSEDNNEPTTEPTEPENNTPTEPTTPTEPSGEDNGTTTPTDTPTEPSEGDNNPSTNTDGETSTRENESGETPSTDDTEPNTDPVIPTEEPTVPTEPSTPTEEPTEPVTPVEPETPTVPTEEPQYKIITISSVTYNSAEVPIFDDADYHKLKTTLTYLETTYPNNNVHVVTKSDTGKSIFYFYLKDELTWFLELRTNIDYSLVNHVTTLDNIKELL